MNRASTVVLSQSSHAIQNETTHSGLGGRAILSVSGFGYNAGEIRGCSPTGWAGSEETE